MQNDHLIRKTNLWVEVCTELETRLGRKLQRDEIISAGFVLDGFFSSIQKRQSLLKELFEIGPEDEKPTINLKFHQRLKHVLDRKYEEAYTGNFGEESRSSTQLRQQRHQALRDLNDSLLEISERAFELGEEAVLLIGVPGFIVPKWIWDNLYLFGDRR